MSIKASNSELKRLGRRIAESLPNPATGDLDLLDEYRNHIGAHLRDVEEIISALSRDVVSRLKTHATLFDKLAKLDLAKIQDVGGARCIVRNREVQDQLTTELQNLLPVDRVVDRRADARSGYRAVHLIVIFDDRCPIEIQIRTELQHEWAQRFEQLADMWGRQIRYGELPDDPESPCQLGTRRECVEHMLNLSDEIDQLELLDDLPGENTNSSDQTNILQRARSLFNWIAEQTGNQVR
jgi:ppGpp synthetase/RelA/SpoT-type nucleotidyltranferase